eukprot:Hpha_TRINITY_DN15750_c1_g1::TRINITY_DN15750_c1_g1_i1::g.38184::m.38184
MTAPPSIPEERVRARLRLVVWDVVSAHPGCSVSFVCNALPVVGSGVVREALQGLVAEDLAKEEVSGVSECEGAIGLLSSASEVAHTTVYFANTSRIPTSYLTSL